MLGYVVVGLDQPYTAADVGFPDGRHVRGWPVDELRVLVRPHLGGPGRPPGLHGRALPQGIGGYLAQDACRVEPRLRACILMDAPMPADVVSDGLRQPVLWLTRDGAVMRREGWPRSEIDDHVDTMRAAFERSRADRYLVEIDGAYHIDFTDAPLWTPAARWLGVSGPIGAQRAHRIINGYSTAFFDRHLRDRPSCSMGRRRSTPRSTSRYTGPDLTALASAGGARWAPPADPVDLSLRVVSLRDRALADDHVGTSVYSVLASSTVAGMPRTESTNRVMAGS